MLSQFITDYYYYYYVECHNKSVMLTAIMLSAVMLSVVASLKKQVWNWNNFKNFFIGLIKNFVQ